VEGKVMHLTRRAIKEGNKVEIWYEEKEYLKTARIITILEKAY
jgi:positive regulator of sigma E activity